MDKYAIIVAGGSGLRMGTGIPKQFLLLKNKPVLWYTLTAFLDSFDDIQIILVLPGDHLETGRSIIQSTHGPDRIWMTLGGETRFHSVQNGLKHIHRRSMVFVHDGVRCLVSPDLIRKSYQATLEHGNSVPTIRPSDSLRIETATGNQIVDREKIHLIQTPQTFFSDELKTAFLQNYQERFTDEASVVEEAGAIIHLIEGESTNIKITRPIDMMIAERILEERDMGI
jgi:2-C-methyl-D-erythritol 4-phosphate cytidylyltransferase